VTHRLGVCSWSLRPAGPTDLAEKVRACGLSAVQLALDPVRTGSWDEAETVAALQEAGIAILSGMMAMEAEDYSTLASIKATGGVRPDAHWPENLAAAHANAVLAQRLGIRLVSFHAGFLPHEERHPERRKMLDRLRQMAAAFGAQGVQVAFETGQESADTLLAAFAELALPEAGVNFDPANLVLYGMGEPVAALRQLAPRVRQAHIKDALPARTAGEWGSEVPVGTGSVDWRGFFVLVRSRLPDIDLVIEREAGEQRVVDVRTARSVVESFLRQVPA
jgi:L-ribulose-5-phosphate 3-epimerase